MPPEPWNWHVEWLFTTRAVVIFGVPLLWLALATFIGRRLEAGRWPW